MHQFPNFAKQTTPSLFQRREKQKRVAVIETKGVTIARKRHCSICRHIQVNDCCRAFIATIGKASSWASMNKNKRYDRPMHLLEL